MRSRREMFLMGVDAGFVKSPYTAEQMERIRYPIKNIKYDEECSQCHVKFMIDLGTGYKECIICKTLYETKEASDAEEIGEAVEERGESQRVEG